VRVCGGIDSVSARDERAIRQQTRPIGQTECPMGWTAGEAVRSVSAHASTQSRIRVEQFDFFHFVLDTTTCYLINASVPLDTRCLKRKEEILDNFVTLQQLASQLRVAPLTIRRALATKNIPLVRIGRLLRVRASDAEMLFQPEAPGVPERSSSAAEDNHHAPDR